MSAFDSVTVADAIRALDDLDDFARMTVSVEPEGAIRTILNFIKQRSTPDELTDPATLGRISFFEGYYV